MANVKGTGFFAGLGKFFVAAGKTLAKIFGWISDLWTDVNGQADVRIIAADIGVGAEIVLGIDFLGKMAALNLLGGLMYLAIMTLVGIAVLVLLKMSKDALDKK